MKQMLPHIGFIFKRNIRDKKNIYYIIMMLICSVLLVSIVVIAYLYNINLNNQFNKNISFRALSVSPSKADMMEYIMKKEDKDFEYNLDEIENIPHVTDVYSSKDSVMKISNPIIAEKKQESMYLSYGTETSIPNIIVGKGIKYDDENVAICPNNFYPYDNIVFNEIDKDNIIDGKSLLNKTITATYDVRAYNPQAEKNVKVGEKTVEFKIIGLYDIKESYFEMNQCFIPGKQLEKISKDFYPRKDFTVISSLYVYVDSRNNVNQVKKDLEKMGYLVDFKAYVSSSYILKLVSIFILICVISIIGIILVAFLYAKKRVLNNSNLIGIFSAAGYKKSDIKSYYFIDNMFIFVGTSIVILILSVVVDLIISVSIKTILEGIGITYYLPYFVVILLLIIIGVIFSLANIYYINKKLKKTIIQFIGDN